MAFEGVTKSDWKLFQKKVPEWQERYAARLLEEYKALLSSEASAMDKINELTERIRKDRKSPGLYLEIEKDQMLSDIAMLLRLKIISQEDLEGFRPDMIKFIEERIN